MNMEKETKEDIQTKEKNKSIFFHSSKNRKIQVWTKEEDSKLLELGKDNNYKNWKEISMKMKNRTPTQCAGRYNRIKPGIIKGSWTAEEDEMLMNLIKKYGRNWSFISSIIVSKNSKQIRDRYINKLDKNVKLGRFKQEEDEKILKYCAKFGRKWTKIASYFTGRTGDMIKNRFYSCIRKKINKVRRVNHDCDEGDKKPVEEKINNNEIKKSERNLVEENQQEIFFESKIKNFPNQNINFQQLSSNKVDDFFIQSNKSLIKIEHFNLNNQDLHDVSKKNVLSSNVNVDIYKNLTKNTVISNSKMTENQINYRPLIDTTDYFNLYSQSNNHFMNNLSEINLAQINILQTLLGNYFNNC